MSSGIYQIRNTLNGKCYVGSAVNLKKRWAAHLCYLRHNAHYNPHLQAAFNKYDEEVFLFEILESVEEPEKLLEREQHYLDTMNPEYNISPTAGSPLGVRHTAEARANMSAAKTGERNPNYGKSPNAETRAKIRAANTGKYVSAETRAKMGIAQSGERNPMYGRTGKRHYNYGKHPSEETRRKHSEAISGERHPNYGKHLSAATRAKISVANSGERNPMYGRAGEQNPMYGKHHSEEALAKMSIARKAYWRRKHAEEQEK